jgi:hypothetical protein
MRKQYSTEYVTCAICGRKYAGKIPKKGDGSVLFPRKHYRHIPAVAISEIDDLNIESDNIYLKIVCNGSYREAKEYTE